MIAIVLAIPTALAGETIEGDLIATTSADFAAGDLVVVKPEDSAVVRCGGDALELSGTYKISGTNPEMMAKQAEIAKLDIKRASGATRAARWSAHGPCGWTPVGSCSA